MTQSGSHYQHEVDVISLVYNEHLINTNHAERLMTSLILVQTRTNKYIFINIFPASGGFRHLIISFANSLDPDQV